MKSSMKTFLSLSCLSLLIASGCSTDETFDQFNTSKKSISFAASFEKLEEDDTKSYIDLSSNTYQFTAGDALSVFAEGVNYKFVTSQNGPSVTFSGDVQPAEGYYVLYPYQANATCSSVSGNAVISASIPSVQTATKNSYDPLSHLSVSQLDSDLNFTLQHAVSRVKFIPRERFVKATFESLSSNDVVAGPVNIAVSSTPSCVPAAGNNTYKVELVAPNGMEPGYTYFISIIPQTFANGVKLTLTKENGDEVIVKTKPLTFTRNRNMNFGEIGDDTTPDYLKFTAVEASTISLVKTKSPQDINISYSIDNLGSWNVWDWESQTISLEPGQSVYFKGANTNGFNSSVTSYHSFQMTGSLTASGDVMSLVYGESENYSTDHLTIPSDACFAYLFYGCKALKNAPTMSATTLKPSCYSNMYMNSGITSVSLPAKELQNGSYKQMFYGCKDLTKIETSLTDVSYLKTLYSSNWLMLASATGNIYINIESGTYTANYSSIPAKWTIKGIGE